MTLAAMLVPVLAIACGQSAKTIPPLQFNGGNYIHRYSKGNLHEFTPKNQPDLKTWTDMFTINDYPSAKDGEGLALAANAVLDAYKAAQAKVVRTHSVPRTANKPAEHLIVVLFPQPKFIEVSFTRFVMNRGAGASMVYSHRVYGEKVGDAMSKWLMANGEKIEKALMSMPLVPKH